MVNSPRLLLEACVDSVESALAAERGGAHRLELCASLADGGTTPSAGMIAAVTSSVRIPVFVIVRPRGGGFVYSAAELDVMRRDVELALDFGAHGIVIGALGGDRRVAQAETRALVAAARGAPVTFHRAFDLVPDQCAALDELADSGVQRILTSGGAATAREGAEQIARLVAHAGTRVVVMAGGGIREDNVADVVRIGRVREIHVRGTRLRGAGDARYPIALRKPLPADEGAWEETDAQRVATMLRLGEAAIAARALR
ncbi:MAG TPA: copper homeostasis protein CutC [Gemmatimonadaceae bacterium]